VVLVPVAPVPFSVVSAVSVESEADVPHALAASDTPSVRARSVFIVIGTFCSPDSR
jgi:hypothetical protein